MFQDVIQRSTAADTASEEKNKEKETEKLVAEVVDIKSLSIEERFARAASSSSSFSSKYVARGAGSSMSAAGPKKSLEEEYPTLGVAVAKSAPAPLKK
jgi:hypothetical protein